MIFHTVGRENENEMSNLKITIVASLLLLHSTGVIAVAKENLTLKYNKTALVHIYESLEGCNFKNPCVEFLQNDAILDVTPRRFELLDFFETISMPVNGSDVILAKNVRKGGSWIVYDLKTQRTLLETENPELANGKFESLTHKKPELINAIELEKKLERSRKGDLLDFYDSIQIAWLLFAVLSPFIFIIIVVIAFSRFINRKKKVVASN